MALQVRDARLEDAQSLARLVHQLAYPTPGEALARRVAQLVASEADRLVVAELDGHVVGLASVHVSLALEYDEPAVKVSAIVVDERCRRRGIGESLVREVQEEARRRGWCPIFLTTGERRADAHAFERRLGVGETERRFAKWLG